MKVKLLPMLNLNFATLMLITASCVHRLTQPSSFNLLLTYLHSKYVSFIYISHSKLDKPYFFLTFDQESSFNFCCLHSKLDKSSSITCFHIQNLIIHPLLTYISEHNKSSSFICLSNLTMVAILL